MDLNAEFQNAVQNVETLDQRPANNMLLKLYGLYKQATEGDVKGERPGGFDFKAMAKYNAWKALAGKVSDDAKTEYVALVNSLLNK